ncbi:MAG: LytTR family DNA-binding domain-containing protein [Lachnospiraceae bacterium]|nr:LytTR family DNA-binding domain-containing protein [Lachnospiraceae bacterium]
MRIIICDDDRMFSNKCSEMLEHYRARTQKELLIEYCVSGEELLFKIEDAITDIDLIYMDIDLAHMDGMKAAVSLRSAGYTGDIVFYTFHRKYAIAGYDVEALHYMIKDDISQEKFDEILKRAMARKDKKEQETIVLTCRGETRCVPLREIKYFEIQARIVTIHYEQQSFEFYTTMGKLEERMYGKGFVRIHKSYLVNRDYIGKLTTKKCCLRDGTELPAGSRYVEKINRKDHS